MPDDDITLGELGRRLRDMREEMSGRFGDLSSEIRSLRAELVRRDVYDANRITDQQRMYSLEAKIEEIENERRNVRRLVYGSAFTAVASSFITVGAHFLNVHGH